MIKTRTKKKGKRLDHTTDDLPTIFLFKNIIKMEHFTSQWLVQ